MTMENEYVMVSLYMNKTLRNKFTLKMNKGYLIENKICPKSVIDATKIKNVLEYEDLVVSEESLDIIRTTPSYANSFNSLLTEDKDCSACCDPTLTPYMLCYADANTFIGDAFINFVSALVVYDMFPNERSCVLSNYMNMLVNNEHIAKVMAEKLDFEGNITKLRKIQISNKQKAKEMASSYKGLIGALYKENGIDKITNIMTFVNKSLIPQNPVDFTGVETSNIIREMVICALATVFGWSMCYISIKSI